MDKYILSQNDSVLYPMTKAIIKTRYEITSEDLKEYLGEYNSPNETNKVWLEIQKWLKSGNKKIFKMPAKERINEDE